MGIHVALTKPHGEQLRALDADEVGLALVGNGLCQQRLTTACSPPNIASACWRHGAEITWQMHHISCLQLLPRICKETVLCTYLTPKLALTEHENMKILQFLALPF